MPRLRSSPSRKDRFSLDTLAGTIRSIAHLFYSERPEDNYVKPLRDDSERSSEDTRSPSPKKSVRFRSGSALTSTSTDQSSPIPIPLQLAPKLPDLDNVSAFRLKGFGLEDLVPPTARPQDSSREHVQIPDQIASRAGLKLCLDEIALNQDRLKSAQPTPLVMGDLVDEDPFSDAAAIQQQVNPFDEPASLSLPTSPALSGFSCSKLLPYHPLEAERSVNSKMGSNDQTNDVICEEARMPTLNVELSQADHENIDSGTLATGDTGSEHEQMPRSALADTSNNTCSMSAKSQSEVLKLSRTSSSSHPPGELHASSAPPGELYDSKYRTSTDEFEDNNSATEIESSWHSRNAIENAPNYRSVHGQAGGDWVEDSYTQDLPRSVTTTPQQQDLQVSQLPNASQGAAVPQGWTAFRDARFVLLAADMLERFPDDFKKLLSEQGLNPRLWSLLDLDASNGPPPGARPMGRFVLESFCDTLREASSTFNDIRGPYPSLSIRQSLIRNKLRRGQRLALFDGGREMDLGAFNVWDDAIEPIVRDRATTASSPVNRGTWSGTRRNTGPSRSSEVCAEICDGHHYFNHSEHQRDISGGHYEANHNERRLFTGTDSTLD